MHWLQYNEVIWSTGSGARLFVHGAQLSESIAPIDMSFTHAGHLLLGAINPCVSKDGSGN